LEGSGNKHPPSLYSRLFARQPRVTCRPPALNSCRHYWELTLGPSLREHHRRPCCRMKAEDERTQSSTSPDASTSATGGDAPPRKKQKRNKPTLSCEECVERKTKVSAHSFGADKACVACVVPNWNLSARMQSANACQLSMNIEGLWIIFAACAEQWSKTQTTVLFFRLPVRVEPYEPTLNFAHSVTVPGPIAWPASKGSQRASIQRLRI